MDLMRGCWLFVHGCSFLLFVGRYNDEIEANPGNAEPQFGLWATRQNAELGLGVTRHAIDARAGERRIG